jgi:hypothetical protein
VWLGLCCEEDWPSPKVHAKAGLPAQFDGVAVDAKETGLPTCPVAGTVAVQEREQSGAAAIAMEPDFVQVTPATATVSAQE